MAITAGIDAGAKNTKVVILRDGEVVGRGTNPTGFDQSEAVERAFVMALEEAGIARDQVNRTVATGAGRKAVPMAQGNVTEVTADARGANRLMPSARTVIDVGAEEGRGISIDERGVLVDSAVNEKCAAGAGAFTESMSRALEVPIEELGDSDLSHRCLFFAANRKLLQLDQDRGLQPIDGGEVGLHFGQTGLAQRLAFLYGLSVFVGTNPTQQRRQHRRGL